MNHVVNWAKKKDLELLIVWPSNQAIKFYERQGFKNKNDIMELEIGHDTD